MGLKGVLFDLDDTLFDHRVCAQTALKDLHRIHPSFEQHGFEEFEQLHAGFLEELHRRVLTGELGIDEARRERFRRLFEACGVSPDQAAVAEAAAAYRSGYLRIRRPIAGAARLLAAVRDRAPIGIVSNNLLQEQQEKLRVCGLAPYVDVLVVSEEAGCAKPDRRIFEIALDRLGCGPADVVMVGDSWEADVHGALEAGIRAVWFNPLGMPPPDAAAQVRQLRALEPVEDALGVILDGWTRTAGAD